MEKKNLRAKGPQFPCRYEIADVAAIQALVRGEASPEQQKRALDWIIFEASGKEEANYYPTDRDTAFALGRVYVGQQIVKLTKLNVSSMRRAEHEE